MKYITYLNIFARLLFTVAIFIFVRKQSDYFMVPILNSLGVLAAGYWSFNIVKRDFGISFKKQKRETLLYHFKDANHIFIANVAISLYTISTTFILGLFTNNTIVGYYAGAEKIIQAFKGLMTPISQTVYPYISKKFSISTENGLRFLKRMTKYVGAITGVISLLILVFSKPLVTIILGAQYYNSIIVLQLLSFTVFMIGLSNIYAVQGLYALGQQKVVMRFIVIISIIHFLIALVIIYLFQEKGAGISVLFTETAVTLVSIMQFNKIVKGAMIKKIIYKKAKNFVERVLKEESQNIRRELDRRALRSTAEYVGEKMSYVSSVDTKYKVHDVAVNNISILEGVVIEFGVYKGDTINYIARKLPSFDVFGFDSFEGLPEFWRDGFDKGTFSLNSLPEVEKNVKLYKGWFDDTLPQFVKENKQKIAYLHVDCDLYNSTKLIFEYLKDRILQER